MIDGSATKHCPNCGAIKRGSVCEYCGTHFGRYQGQVSVEVTPDYTDLYTWDGAVAYRIYNEPNVTVTIKNEDC